MVKSTTMNMLTLEDIDYVAEEPRLPMIPDPISWSPRVAFDLAMGDTPEVVAERYEFTPDLFERVLAHPAFRREVSQYIKDIREKGVTFKAKARLQAEEYLEVLDDIVHDPDVGNSIKLDAIKFVTKCADLDGSGTSGATGMASPQFNIQINL